MSGSSRSTGSRTAGSSRKVNGSESVRASSPMLSAYDAAFAASFFLFALILCFSSVAAFWLLLPAVFFPVLCFRDIFIVFPVRHEPSAA